MADVNIPVIVDIEGAFEDAANRVSTAMKPLQQAVDKGTLDLRFDVAGGGDYKYFDNLRHILNEIDDTVGHTNFAFERLKYALDDAQERLNKLYTRAAKNAGGILSTEDQLKAEELREAIVLLETEIDLRTRAGRLASEAAQKQIAISDAISRGNAALLSTATTTKEIGDKISALRGKLQNIDPRSDEWMQTAKEIKSATEELAKYDKQLKEVLNPTKQHKAGSIDRIRAEMQALEQTWNAMSRTQKFDKDGSLKKSAQRVIDKYRELTKEAEIHGKRLSDYANKATKATNKLGDSIKRAASAFGIYLSVHSLVRFAKQIRDVTGELEYQRVALGHLLQDVDAGNRLFERTVEAAKQSPFRITQLVTYTKQLAAYRIAQEDLFDTTQRLADISAGLGVDMKRLILAFGQVRAASVLRGQELRQFTEAGIPLVELLADKFTELNGRVTSTAEVFELISKRAVPFSMIADIFEDLTDKGGMFYKMQEEQAKTLKGRWEKLKDAYDQALMGIGETDTFQNFNDLVLKILNGVANNLRGIVRFLNAGSVAWLAYKAATAVASSATVTAAKRLTATGKRVGILTIGVRGLSRAWSTLVKAFKTNWVGWVITAVAGAITYFTSFKEKVDKTAESIKALQKATEEMHESNKAAERINKIIDRYERLASRTDLTKKESENLEGVIERLNQEFPELKDKLEDENRTLEDKIKLLRDETNARLERQRSIKKDVLESYKNQLKDKEEQLKQNEADEEAATKEYNAAIKRRDAINERAKSVSGFLKALSNAKWVVKGAEDAAAIAENRLNSIRDAGVQLTDTIKDLKNEISGLEKEINGAANIEGPLTSWQDTITKVQESMLKGTTLTLFTPAEIEQITSAEKAYDALNEKMEGLRKTIAKNSDIMATAKDSGTLLNAKITKEEAETLLKVAEAINSILGFRFTTEGSSRDTRLSQLKSDISELTNAYKKFQELRKYKTEEGAIIDINTLFPQLKGEVPSLDYVVSELEKRLEQVKADLKKSPKSKTLLDMKRTLETEISNLKFDDLKDKLEKKLKKLSEEVKRSEAARNFYKDIFDLTGDETLATSLSVEVYGGIGDEFKERLQQQLAALFEGVEVDDAMRNAIDTQDFDYIFANLPEGMEKVREELKKLREDSEKFSADQIKTWVNELKKAKTYGGERVRIARTTQERIAEINRSNLPDEEKKSLIAQYVERESKEIAKLQYEAFKDSPMYIALFEDLDAASGRMLDNMRKRLVSLRGQWSSLDPVQLKEMQKRMEEIDSSMARRNPFKALSKSIKEYQALLASGRTRKGDEEAAVSAEQNRQTAETNLELALKDLAVKKAAYEQSLKQNGADSTTTKLLYGQMKAANALVDARKKEADAATKSANQAQENANQWSRLSSSVLKSVEAMSTFSVAVQALKKNVHDIVDLFAEMSGSEGLSEAADLLESMAEAAGNAASGLARVMAGDISGAGDLLSAKMAGIQLVLKVIDMINNAQLRDWDRQMEEQEKTLARLQRSYDKLGDAMENAFGSDYLYNYNEQLKNLAAQQEAYTKQLAIQQQKSREASRDEDRKAAADEAENLKQQISDVEKQAKEVTQSMQEFFAGTDLTSAAEAFADSWLDAYREFGDTTGAIKEKMQEMIDNLIVKSVLADAAKAILAPFFREINNLSEANDMTPENIAKLATMLNGKVQDIDASMSSWMTVLQSLGVKTRGQIGSFTGIARDIASASEESILGLAAGINTQNYYMSYVPMIHTNLEQVLALMGGSPTTPTVAPSAAEEGPAMPSVQEMIYDHLPNIDRNLADIKQMLSDVIKPVGTTASKYVAARM